MWQPRQLGSGQKSLLVEKPPSGRFTRQKKNITIFTADQKLQAFTKFINSESMIRTLYK